jgi:hypothetical protein
VDTLLELKRIRDQLQALGKLGLEEDHGLFKSIYGHDPDGLLFEINWFLPADAIRDEDRDIRTARWIGNANWRALPATRQHAGRRLAACAARCSAKQGLRRMALCSKMDSPPVYGVLPHDQPPRPPCSHHRPTG